MRVILFALMTIFLAGCSHISTKTKPNDFADNGEIKYISSVKAFAMTKSDLQKLNILDVRTPGEYIFVGHPQTAVNIPSQFLANDYDFKRQKIIMKRNPDFIREVKLRFKYDDFVGLLCRSGGQSVNVYKLLRQNGYRNLFVIKNGFEGDEIDDKSDLNYGKRIVNGWKNEGLPWTYQINPDLMYIMR